MTDHPTMARLDTIAERPVLRFERRLPHPVDRVWQVLTRSDELAAWFPAVVDTEPRVGAHMWFTVEGEQSSTHGEVLERTRPHVYAFRWQQDALRFELLPQPPGCLLVFTHALGGDWAARLGAARVAAGWDSCLAALCALLDGRPADPPADRLGRVEAYVDAFELGAGEVQQGRERLVVRFARDLVWKSVADVWDLLTECREVTVGEPPPRRFTPEQVASGPVRAVRAPSTVEYDWLHDGDPAGLVRWELVHDPSTGTRGVLTQTVPAVLSPALPHLLALWHLHLELVFAAVQGAPRAWSAERAEELQRRYRAGLGGEAEASGPSDAA